LLLVAAHHGRAAIANVIEHFQVFDRQAVVLDVGIPVTPDDVRDFQGLSPGKSAVRRWHRQGFPL
jgi:hypothetical protein